MAGARIDVRPGDLRPLDHSSTAQVLRRSDTPEGAGPGDEAPIHTRRMTDSAFLCGSGAYAQAGVARSPAVGRPEFGTTRALCGHRDIRAVDRRFSTS